VANATLDTFVRRLSAAAGSPRTDQELLAEFATNRDEAAFAALVGRYGRLVRNVCRNVLDNEEDAEEALQATFVLLARQAGSLREPGALAGWLHGVAHRTALRVRRDAARRRAREARTRPGSAPPGPVVEASWRELQAILDAELQRLPEKLRAPFVLCCLEGRPLREAARCLGWKPGTVSGRLNETRKLLRLRLARRGVSLSAALCGLALVNEGARAGLPAARVAETVRTSLRLAGNRCVTLGLAALALGVVGALAISIGVGLWLPAAQADEPNPTEARRPEPPEPAAPAAPRVDHFGDPLPAGTFARLGSKRFGHSWTSSGILWSPDGKTLASVGGFTSARRLCLWDAATGRELHDLAARGTVPSAAFTPDGSGLWAQDNRGLLLWDVATGKESRRFPNPAGAWTIALSPGGDMLAVAQRDKNVRVLEVLTGRTLHDLAGPEARGLAFAPDGQSLAAAGAEGSVLVWDLATGKKRWQVKAQKFAQVVVFAPDGKSVASVGGDGTIRLWDAATGKELRTIDDKVQDGPDTVAFSPDGSILAAPGKEGGVIYWDPATGKEIRRWQAASLRVNSISFSPDGRTLATGNVRGSRIRLWDAATGKPLLTVAEHNALIDTLSFSPDGKTLWSLAPDKTLIRWDVAKAEGEALFGGPANGMFDRAVASRDGRLLATGGRLDGRVRLWDTHGHELAELGKHEGGFVSLAFSPDGKFLASSGKETLRLWDVATRKEVRRFEVPADNWNTLIFSSDGRRLAVSGGGGLGNIGHSPPRVLDVATGKELVCLDSCPSGVQIVFSADGKYLATSDCNDDRKPPYLVRIWDAATGKQLGQFTCPTKTVGIASLAISPDARLIATGGFERDDTVRLWETASCSEVASLQGHHSGVFSLAFTPDGKTLATGSGDATILLWDVTGAAIGGPARPERLSPARLEQCWKDLQSTDAGVAYRAIRALAGDPARAVPFLREHLPTVQPVDPAKLKQLLAELGAGPFKVREKAEAELLKLGAAAEAALRKYLDGEVPDEGRERAERIVETLMASLEWLRAVRAVAALEYGASPEARQVLEALAKGAADALLTREARAAQERLKGRSPDWP
jgi:RNA polymerase sigma factor (sigma-70 family)